MIKNFMRTTSSASLAFGFIVFITLIRLAVAPFFGLGVDEAHYALYGRYLDWSYFDHPPLVGWIHAFFQLFGESEFWVRLPAILLGALISWFSFRLMLKITQNATIALAGMIAINASFIINALFLMLLPDTLLMPILFMLIFLVLQMEEEAHTSHWIGLGILLGLAGLSKYSAILLVPSLILYLLVRRRYDLLFSPKLFLSALIAFMFITPVLYWNIQHEWISFTYQSAHVIGTEANWGSFLKSLGAQIGAYSPFLFILSVAGIYKALREPSPTLTLLVLIGGIQALFFLYSALFKTVLPHWSIHFYLLFIPVGVYFLWHYPRMIRWFIGLSLGITLLAYIELAIKPFAFNDYKTAHRDIYGWDIIMKKAADEMKNNPNLQKAIAVTNWTQGSRANYYNFSAYKVYVADTRYDQFDLWEQDTPEGKDLLFITTRFSQKDIAKLAKCDKVESTGEFDLNIRKTKANTGYLHWCYNYQGLR